MSIRMQWSSATRQAETSMVPNGATMAHYFLVPGDISGSDFISGEVMFCFLMSTRATRRGGPGWDATTLFKEQSEDLGLISIVR